MVGTTVPVLNESEHAVSEMNKMYEAACTAMRSKDENLNAMHVYELYDCVSLILAHMYKEKSVKIYVVSFIIIKSSMLYPKKHFDSLFIK